MLLKGDTNPALRAEVPAALGALHRGDRGPLGRLIAHAGGRVTLAEPDATVAPALYAATTCEELSFPWNRAAGLQARARQAAAIVADCRPPTSRRSTAAPRWAPSSSACAWAGPRRRRRRSPIGPLPAVPTLMLERRRRSADADRGRARDGRAAAAQRPDRRRCRGSGTRC